MDKRFEKPSVVESMGIDGMLRQAVLTGQPVATDLGIVKRVEKPPRTEIHLSRVRRILGRFHLGRFFK